MKLLLTLVLTLLFLALESVAVKYMGLGVARIDVTVAIVAFLSLRAGLLEGAVASYAVGYLLDLMTGRPTGLYTLLAVVTFLLGRIAAGLVDVRSGLIVQTARLSAPTMDALTPRLPQLAQVLMMTDEQKLAFEQQLAAVEVAVRAAS